jgi:hypothetical protein
MPLYVSGVTRPSSAGPAHMLFGVITCSGCVDYVQVAVPPQPAPVKEIKQYQKKWLQHVMRMDTEYQSKHYNIDRKDEGT